ncbi:hypothetical protein [Comamonas thiooxydans]|uniref:hypothetical protein n=1 Tax=Comamonas TaxID=283 RepID=UPI001CCF4B14|nr:hypothetical protein [Comamonas thiooxydans]MCO8250883.1 hypothetical protein [Comamonas thiooxydans]UBQ40786.1 hypothetical protein LCH15_18965 [Comamonas thiooxydans]
MDLVDSTSAAVFKRHFSERNTPGDLLCAIGLKRMDVCQMDDAVGARHGIARHGSAPDCAKLCTVAVQLRKDERAREILPYSGKGKAWGCGVIDAPAFRVENGRLDGSEAAFSAWVCSAGLDRNTLLRGFQLPALTLEGCGLYSKFRRKKLSWRSFGKKRVAPMMSTWGRSWIDLSAGTSLDVVISVEWLHICRAQINKGGLKPALVR